MRDQIIMRDDKVIHHMTTKRRSPPLIQMRSQIGTDMGPFCGPGNFYWKKLYTGTVPVRN